ncbi:protein kinase domain-containing protein [Deinococcus aquiradiocola]|uniref:protein kinase domain-containing protein n=1 Tax=Deinococcus aquiradiocola TaxID=393059 RepID=UPI00166D8F8B|nr:protein kinase [Deinococcus aquiradiocola]
MNLLLLIAIFVVALLLLIRPPERITAIAVAGLAALLAVSLAVLGGLDRAWGVLAVTAVLATGAWVRFSQDQEDVVRAGGRPTRRQPLRVQRTAKPTLTNKHPSTTQTGFDLRFQDYDVLDRIGVGGMGSVYRARRKNDNRIVALKVPQEKYLADAKFVKRFYREAEVLKRFSHASIVRVYDYKAQGAEHYIAMEFLDGESLEAVLEERQMSFSESVQVIRTLSDALRHIHAQNVVHRDIKPANVMLLRGAFVDGKLREGGVKLMDFGIAVGKVLTRLTMTGARVGTPIYMAPEQAKGNRVDARSDVYSLGLLAYEMVSGQTAFKGSYEAVVHQQVFESPKPPRQIRLEVPGKLNDLILSMIEKDPASRPTLDEVIARIDAGVLSDEQFEDPMALAISLQEKRGALRLLDLSGKLRVSLRDIQGPGALPSVPNALCSDPDGNLYLSMLEYRQGKSGALIRKLGPDGTELLSFGAYGLGEDELLQPISIAVQDDRVYVLDAEAFHVVVFSSDGSFVRRFGGRGPGQGRFEAPKLLAAAPAGDIHVLDSGSREVQRFTPEGQYISRYAFRQDRNSDTLRPLDGLGVDVHGAVYIVDGAASKLRKIEADGTPGLTFPLDTLVGEPNDAPWLLQVTPEGQIYAVRRGGQVLRTYNSVGDLLTSADMYAPVQAVALLPRPHASGPAPALDGGHGNGTPLRPGAHTLTTLN